MSTPIPKLTVLLREDLSPGRKLAQVFHAGHKWSAENPHDTTETVIVRSVADEDTLQAAHMNLVTSGFRVTTFVEPDYGEKPTLTAIVVEAAAFRALRKYPLAGTT